MNQSPLQSATPSASAAPKADSLRRLTSVALLLGLCFALPLSRLAIFALHSELYSHILLIPVVSGYLIWNRRATLPPESAPNRAVAGIFILLGALTLALSWNQGQGAVDTENYLAGKILSLLFFLLGGSAWVLGRKTWHALLFPLVFLIFMVPFPTEMLGRLELFLQHGSAAVALAFFRIAGTSVFHQDLLFQLRGINLQVAPECSGIHSTLALFITSVLAGHFFLRSPWKCVALSLAVLPLALVRNGFRIFTIGELCVHVSPDMIDSYIHHHGGPIFFVLSLIPFFFLLRFLHKSEPRP